MPWARKVCLQSPATAVSSILKVLFLLVSSQHEQKITNIKSPLEHPEFLCFCLHTVQYIMLCIFLPENLLSKTTVGIWGEIFFWSFRMDWCSDSYQVWKYHRTLQTSMDNPKVLKVRNLQSFLLLKTMCCLNAPAALLWQEGWILLTHAIKEQPLQ